MFITLDNNIWVHDPIFYGHEWFLACREDTILTIHIYRDPTDKTLFTRARKILREAKIYAKIADEPSHRHRAAFPPGYNGLKQAASIRLLMAPKPVPAGLACHAIIYTGIEPSEEVANECITSVDTNCQVD